MPVVPTLDPSNAVAPSIAPTPSDQSVVTAGLLNQGNQATAQMGDALGQAANTTSQMTIDAQNLANETRVNDAVNQLKETQQNLTYDPQNGFMSQTGIKALQRDSGMPLADEYVGKLTDTASQISAGLSNPMQQRMFQEQARNIAAAMHGQATDWEGQQFKAYALSTQDGTIKNAVNQAVLAYDNPDAINDSLQSIKAAVYQSGKISGAAATEIEANQRTATSMAVTGAIESALQKGQISYANGLLQKYGTSMSADDILRVNGKMNTFLGTQAAMNAVTRVFSQAGPQLSNSPFDRMIAITQQSESGGKETNSDGSTVTSPKGAQGVMQVMPATSDNPGFGVKPWDGTPQDRARVGRDYLYAMLGRYGGDPAKAWAAYNGGPGTLDAAMAQAQKDGKPGAWLTYMPQETQAYVQQNVQAYQSGNTGANRPSKLDVINSVRSDPILQQKPEWMQQAVTMAGQRYDEETAAITQRDTANKATVLRTLAQNRGNINAVSPADLANLNPDDLTDVLSFSKKMSEGTNTTNTALYQTLVTQPKLMSDMSDAQWQTQAPNFSVDDYKHLTQMRADLINNTGTNAPGSVNLRAVNETLSQRLQSMGIDPYPKSKGFGADPDAVTRVGAIRQFAMQSLLDAQKQAGKKFTEADIEDHIDNLFAKSVTFHNVLQVGPWSMQRPDRTMNMLSMAPSDIPDDTRTKLMSDFAAHGIPRPTPGQLLGAYWMLKTASEKLSSQ